MLVHHRSICCFVSWHILSWPSSLVTHLIAALLQDPVHIQKEMVHLDLVFQTVTHSCMVYAFLLSLFRKTVDRFYNSWLVQRFKKPTKRFEIKKGNHWHKPASLKFSKCEGVFVFIWHSHNSWLFLLTTSHMFFVSQFWTEDLERIPVQMIISSRNSFPHFIN